MNETTTSGKKGQRDSVDLGIATQYINLMIKCAKDEEFRENLLDPSQQGFIKKTLREDVPLMQIPSDACVLFDKDAKFGKVYISNSQLQFAVEEKFHLFDLTATYFKSLGSDPKVVFEKLHKKDGEHSDVKMKTILDKLKKSEEELKIDLKQFNILIILPFYLLSDVAIWYPENNTEAPDIILSTC